MRVILAGSHFGLEFIEDTDTGELSLQCMCGGMAMYERRVVLTAEEVEEFRAGTFDAASLVYEICHETPRALPRLVPTFPPGTLVGPKP